jgi:hypothetical protein
MSKTGRAKILFTTAAGLSFFLSVYLWFTGQKEEGMYVGLWVPSILAFGALVLHGRENSR